MDVAKGSKREAGQRLLVGFLRVRDGHRTKLVPREKAGNELSSSVVPLRVARLLSFAHRLERRIDTGQVKDRATAARELDISRARLTQILNLTLLAPDIQEEILFTEVEPGFQPINERVLRWVVRARDWPTQRARWKDLNSV